MDELRAREAARMVPDGARRMGLDEPIPDEFPGHLIKAGVEVRRFPACYLTRTHLALVRIWRLKCRGYQPRSDGVLHWPARFAHTMDLLDAELAELEESRRSKRS